MRILYVVSRPLEINTSSSIRNRATIEGLLALGNKVNLITTEFDKNHSNYDDSILDNNLLSKGLKIKYLKLSGVQEVAKVIRRYKFLKPLKELASIIISKFEIYDNLKDIADYALKTNIIDDRYDLIISSSDPKSSHLFVCKMFENKLLKDIPWIQIWGDPFLKDISNSNRFLNSKIKKEENRLLRYADKIIYVSSITLREQKKLYPQYSMKMSYEPAPYIKQELYPIDNETKESITFLYCGDYSSNIRNIKPLYECIKAANHMLTICGSSDIKLASTENIKIYPRVSFKEIKELERKCDVLIHLSNIEGSQIPGKIYQYSGTNKLILFILDGEIEALVNTFSQYGRYIFCQNNISDISTAIQQIYNGMYDSTKFIVEDFQARKIADGIIRLH